MTRSRIGALQQLRWNLAGWARNVPYRWAHKPLCDRFHADVVRLGGLHICRSCLGAWAGLILGGATLAWMDLSATTLGWMLATALPLAVAGSFPPLHARRGRPARDLLRVLGGCTVALTAVAALQGQVVLALTAAVLLTGFGIAWRRRRAPLRADRCAGCPELEQQGVCSGFARQADVARAHERSMEADLLRGGFAPDLPHELRRPDA